MSTTSRARRRKTAMQSFTEQITKEMKLRGWSASDLALESGVTVAYIYRILSGQQNPSMQVADKLAAALGLVITTAPAK